MNTARINDIASVLSDYNEFLNIYIDERCEEGEQLSEVASLDAFEVAARKFINEKGEGIVAALNTKRTTCIFNPDEGFWSNMDGWVFSPRDATLFEDLDPAFNSTACISSTKESVRVKVSLCEHVDHYELAQRLWDAHTRAEIDYRTCGEFDAPEGGEANAAFIAEHTSECLERAFNSLMGSSTCAFYDNHEGFYVIQRPLKEVLK